MYIPKDPSDETLENRKAADALVRDAAINGCPIAGALFELLHAASLEDHTRYMTTTAYDYREEDQDDDIRPY